MQRVIVYQSFHTSSTGGLNIDPIEILNILQNDLLQAYITRKYEASIGIILKGACICMIYHAGGGNKGFLAKCVNRIVCVRVCVRVLVVRAKCSSVSDTCLFSSESNTCSVTLLACIFESTSVITSS